MKRQHFVVRFMVRDHSQLSDYRFIEIPVRARTSEEAIKIGKIHLDDNFPISESVRLL